MNARHRCTPLALLGLVLVLAGCSSKPQLYTVTGEVTWLGKDLPEGKIVFEDSDPEVAPVPGDITNGKFEVKLTAGKKKVKIMANRDKPGAKLDRTMGAVPREQYIPARYNNTTTLEANVTEDGENHFTFPLNP